MIQPKKLNLSEVAKPAWWPECPWPEDVWGNTLDDMTPMYKRLVADDYVRTCFSGVLMRHGWRLAEKAIMESLAEQGIVLDPSTTSE